MRRQFRGVRVDAGVVLEAALWAALGHILVGVLYTTLHIELMGQLSAALSPRLTVFADLAGLLTMVALWPVLLASAWLCGVTGCGLI
ncbi:addiction module protein [Mycobacterium sp. MYCO198283]|uniref:addiction module protein n=1 Tax=Mycobacterium sp. MYCO198283 TaxID=2883505 RepID=UPI001E324E5E|nr:addiction module protein [Mycobacterium sp. MYCO198283]MCG5432061.1 addiction module protein [Mycobacterium sp. MYCO198283]